MKKVLLSIFLSACFLGLSAQKGTSFFLGLQSQVGFPVGETVLESTRYIGFTSDISNYGPSIPSITAINYGVGLQGGINLNDRWFISTGIQYNRRKDQYTFYCHVCDFVLPPEPTILRFSSIQLPLDLRFHLNTNSTFFPFLKAGASWNHLFEGNKQDTWLDGTPGFNFWSYSLGGGIGFRTQKNTEFLFMTQYNRDISDRTTFPNFVFRDLSFAVLGVFKFSSGE